MSSSVFTESPAKPSDDDSSACGGDSQPNNVVVVYGKNGITVDPAGLERLIDEETISSLSVIRLTSPTPSMKSERDEETEEKIQMATDGIELISNLQFAEENEKNSESELVGLTVEEFYPPEEAKKIAKEILNYAGLTHSKQIKTYDYEFLRYVIENDHCYTPLRSPTEVSKPSQNTTSTTNDPSSLEKITSPLRQYGRSQKVKKAVENIEPVEEKPQEKENDDEVDEESDYTTTSLSDSDNDRDSDLDFNVNDRGRRRKTSVRRKKIAPKITKKRQSFTEKDNSNLTANSSFEDERKATSSQRSAQRQIAEGRRNSNASLKGASGTKSAMQRQSHPPQLTVIQKLQASHQSPQKPPQIQIQQQIVQKPSQIQQQSVQRQSQVLHQKSTQVQQQSIQRQPQLQQQSVQKPSQLQLVEQETSEPKFHVFEKPTRAISEQSTSKHQFTNIFQQPTPQVVPSISQDRTNKPRIVILNGSNFNEVRSISTDSLEIEPKPISTPDRVKVIATVEAKPPLQTVSINRTIQQQQTKGFMPLVADAATKSQLPAQISIQTHSSSSSSPCPNDIASENDKQLDLIDSIVQDEMKKSSVVVPEPPMNENIPQIVKMLENTEKAILSKQPPKTISLTSSRAFTTRVEDIDITNAPLLDSAEDDIADDLLQQVAELIDENKKVEEALEAHVLMTNARQIEQSEPMQINVSSVNPSHQTPVSSTPTLVAPHKQMPSAVKKDPIQIVRGDGRVITLPPIEAPTTRAKRRAQTQGADTSTPVSTKGNARKDSTDSRGQTSNSNSRRNSATEQKAANARKRNSISAQSTPKLEEDFEEDDDDDDEGSSDSEDDPNRLWCICRQPHNNRFMICCDKCEDWFHGTCVNITKAMGLEMESKGVEWTCPKCIKQMDAHTKKSVQRKINEIFEKRQAEEAKKPTEIKKPAVLSKKAENQRKLSESAKKTGETKVQKKLLEAVKPVQAEMIKSPPVRLNISSVVLPTPTKTSTPNASSTPSAHTSAPATPEIKPQRQEQHAAPSAPVSHQPPPKIDGPPPVSCIVCKKNARQNSIYCSDECIRVYAQNAIALTTKASKTTASPVQPATPNEERKKKPFSSFEEALALASEPTLQVKNKIERVYVFERKSGKILTGNNAPTTANLKKWLQDNPTYEVVQPGSPQAMAIERSKQKQKAIANQEPVVKKVQDQPHKIVRLVSEQEKTRHTPSPKLRKYPPNVSLKPGTPQPTTPTYEKAAEQKTNQETKTTKHNEDAVKSPTHNKSIKKQISTEQNAQQQQQQQQQQGKSQQATTPNAAKEAEPIRLNVKRTLKSQLMARMAEVDDPKATKLSEGEMESFANETENEMFKLFNKDTGSKYKAKYRSLMFNIKDRKNQTLFQKICEKVIEPKQLVRMSAEEMASQELAEWRQNENKHQLEMIKKSELDLLSCTKNYVLKTHKGEEVIESKSTDRVSLDITIPVEDVVTVLNNSSVTGIENEEASPEVDYAKASSIEFSHDSDSSFKNTSSLSNSKLANSNVSSSKEERKKNKDRDRERERDKDKERERDKDKQREREKDRDRVRERDRDREREREKRHRSREKHKSKKRSRSRSRERRHSKQMSRDHEKEKKVEEITREANKDFDAKKKDVVSTTTVQKKDVKDIKEAKPKSKTEQTPAPKDCNLIDKILESTKTVEEAANLIAAEKEKATKSIPTSTVMISKTGESLPYTQLDQNENSSNGMDSDQEPSSTVVIPTPPEDVYKKYSSDLLSVIWSGSINMIDVATFQIVVQPIVGNSSDLKKDLPVELDVVGRIGPETVWDYIEKIKKSPNKEIVLLRVVPFCDTENVAYSALYSYLDKRKRLGVVKTISTHIKDFYILPLAAHCSLPPVLQFKDNAEIFEDDTRPDLLIGIVIRIMNKRHSVSGQQLSKVRKTEPSGITRTSTDEGRFTPPHSPKRFPSSKKMDAKSIIGAGRLPKATDPIDINSIIAPQPKIVPAYTGEDADEPYSPGGSSDEELNPTLNQKEPIVPTNATPDELKRKMEEINRQIEAQKLEIAGMLNLDPQTASKIYSPSNSPTPTLIKPALANISLPPNLHEILSSIKSTEPVPTPVPPPPLIGSIPAPVPKEEPEEPIIPSTTPPPPPKITFDDPLDIALPPSPPPLTDVPPSKKTAELTQAKSRLAQLSEAELLSMVRDNDLSSQEDESEEQQQDKTSKHACESPSDESTAKKPRWDDEPPPPGLEDEFM